MARRKRRRAHGLGCVYERAPGNWWIKWREAGRYRYAHGYATRELAEKVLAKITADVSAGRAGLPQDPNEVATLEELARPWLERRLKTHRSGKDDHYRWGKHVRPAFGGCRPHEVDAGKIRRFIERKLEEVSSTSVLLCVRLLSTFFTDLVEQGLATVNPVRTLPRSTRRLIRPAHDPRTTPFLEKLDDVKRVYLRLPPPLDVGFAVGAFAGLRTGEVFALRWTSVDLEARRIQVRESTRGALKDDESRVVPILDPLLPVLREAKFRSGGQGRVVPVMGHHGQKIDAHTPGEHLRAALEELALPSMTWYQATRHTFASQWVLAGGSVEILGNMLGHSSVAVTERYAHLRPDLYGPQVLDRLKIDLRSPEAQVERLGALSYAGVTREENEEGEK